MTREFVVYGDVDLNLIDGSAIWAQSMVEVLSRVEGARVRLLLKAPIRQTRLVDPLRALDNVEIVRPFEDELLPELRNSLSPFQAAQLLDMLGADRPVDAFVVRGLRLARQLAIDGRFDGRLWTYLTDVPQSASAADSDAIDELTSIAKASRVLLCQTEDLRSHLEQLVPAAVGKTSVTPPVVVAPPEPPALVEWRRDRPLRLVYTGKMAKAWQTEQMTSLPTLLGERGLAAELHVVGDKIHTESDDPDYATRMRSALGSDGVVWHGGVPRATAMEIASSCHVGLSWRSGVLDDSLELSTKVLEFGVMGRAVVLNRTPAHEALLGVDYPLFVSDERSVLAVFDRVAAEPALLTAAATRCRDAAEAFLLPAAVDRFTRLADRLLSERSSVERRVKVVVAGHDLKFMSRLLEELSMRPDLEIRIDKWLALAEHDEVASRELRDWADVIVCEWCGPNAIWYSREKRPDQRLIVRLHRFELYSRYPDELVHDAIDVMIAVDPHYRDLTRERMPELAPERVIDVPNWVDVAAFRRAKLEGARFNLGMIGLAPKRKRFDLALEVVSKVRRVDDRFALFVKSKMPWDYWWIWNGDEERSHFRDALRRMQTDRHLAGAVAFDGFGPDVAAWLRKIGCVLSTSDDESFHLSPAESMASGGTAVVFPWPGADTVYAEDWLVDGVDAAVEAVLAQADPEVWDARRRVATEQIERFDLPSVASQWHGLVTGNGPQ